MTHVRITDQILTGNLFAELGYDEYASAKNLAVIMEQGYRQLAEADYPGATIEVTIEIQRAGGCKRPLEILVTDTEEGAAIDCPDTERYAHQIEHDTEDYRWAVRNP